MRNVFIGLGTNLGDRLHNLRRALEGIEAFDDTHVLAVSGVVETEPWGVADQPLFANAVAHLDTAVPADRLLDLLKELEQTLGREESERFGPRVIDLDILLYDDEEWRSPRLTIPHPRLAEREFAVVPLLEVSPEATWPDGSPVTAARAREGRIVGRLGPVPGFEDRTPVTQPSSGRAAAAMRAVIGLQQPLSGMPIAPGEDAGEWVEVAASLSAAGHVGPFATELLFDAAVLEQEGIPFGWDPMAPNEQHSPWALPRLYRLRVPPQFAERAKALLHEVHEAPLEAPDEGADPNAAP